VLAGEEVVIARNKEPVVRLVGEAPLKKKPLLGAMAGRVKFDLEDGFFNRCRKSTSGWVTIEAVARHARAALVTR
jgi:antitoxin (DNA-binding transcriptional repressor) of toxin-antitoxin stability system